MLLMIRLANISRRAFAAYAIAYGLVFIFLINVVNLLVFYGVGPKTVISRHPLRNLAQRFRYASGTSHADAKTLSALDRYPRLGLPFASFGDAAVEITRQVRRSLRGEDTGRGRPVLARDYPQ